MATGRIALVVALAVSLLVAGAGATAASGPDSDPRDGVEQQFSSDHQSSSRDVVTGPDCVPDDGRNAGDERESPRIVELYPNPTTHGNVGEYVVVAVPDGTSLENWTITDGHTTAALPNETVSGRIAVSADPDVAADLTDHPVLELDGTVRLAVDGDELSLRNGSRTVDAVAYDRAPVAERWHRTDDEPGGDRGAWVPRDGTCFPPTRSGVGDATAFVLPDSPEIPLETIERADDRLLLAGYTVTSDAVAAALVEAADRGVDVAVLFESGPVGGTSESTEPVLETLESGGVDVRAIGGEGARYRFHHAKYAVADDRIVVTSENWKPSGTGGESSRGWGVRIDDTALAAELATVFRADFEGWDTQPSAAFRENATFVDEGGPDRPREAEFETNHAPRTVSVDAAELLVAPDNADRRLEDLLARAENEILVKQASVDADVGVLEESVAAARRGVDVRILLDSTWYHEDDNAALAAELEAAAAAEGLPLEAKLVDDTDRFEKIHAKGVVIDREVAVVGSANWNDNAFENNREVLIVLHGDAAGEYYAEVFEADWRGDAWTLPIELSVAVVAALLAAALVGRRYVRFGDHPPNRPPP
ncbi:phospholipase D-like domain-containing protein [Natrarchaeobius oligotrophus]|uniref:Phospholipase n=1 Tax=Natrarchaeobius chitinivorans TaxID=1679083 RepID=A0A3N6N2K8_NATCH|nr:phospholipase D-like domain-containing protein [Natrarchaeobius chitinivorans]RQH03092.1 phospholipase [Natrarchaeobius chitinivorans]